MPAPRLFDPGVDPAIHFSTVMAAPGLFDPGGDPAIHLFTVMAGLDPAIHALRRAEHRRPRHIAATRDAVFVMPVPGLFDPGVGPGTHVFRPHRRRG